MKKKILLAAAFLLILMGCSPIINSENKIEDGNYSCNVTLEGGSGKATVDSPADVVVEDGDIFVTLVWSSSHYDYMLVDDVKYENEAAEGENSTFTIPVPAFDEAYTVIGDTTAMSTPHEIEYELTVYSPGTSETDESTDETTEYDISSSVSLDGLTYVDSLELDYATQFTVDYYQDEAGNLYNYIVIGNDDTKQEFLQLQDQDSKSDLDTINVESTYLVSTSVMDLVVSIDALDNIKFSGTDKDDWSIDEACDALENGDMAYAGKYSAPDYELLLSKGCTFAIENTMIYHNPEVMEKLQSLDIDVMVERSSYESSPLGRLEWIKLYGVLYDRLDEAEEIFDKQVQRAETISNMESTGKTVAVFSIASNGAVTVRKPGDYITTMIDMAGGVYVPENLGEESDTALSTMNITMEDFYLGAGDADVLIYNGTIEGDVASIDELVAKSSMLAEFDAVKNGNVYCLSEDFFQQSTHVADLIEDVHNILTGDNSLNYLYEIED